MSVVLAWVVARAWAPIEVFRIFGIWELKSLPSDSYGILVQNLYEEIQNKLTNQTFCAEASATPKFRMRKVYIRFDENTKCRRSSTLNGAGVCCQTDLP